MNKHDTYEFLNERNIIYQTYEHDAVYTMEEMARLEIPNKDNIPKNLFLRDDKKRNYYLVTLAGHKKVDLKTLSEQIPSRKLSFANEKWLEKSLSLKAGSVTPLGILNNEARNVIMVFDSDLKGTRLGVHPMENTATIFLAFEDLVNLIRDHGNCVVITSMS